MIQCKFEENTIIVSSYALKNIAQKFKKSKPLEWFLKEKKKNPLERHTEFDEMTSKNTVDYNITYKLITHAWVHVCD